MSFDNTHCLLFIQSQGSRSRDPNPIPSLIAGRRTTGLWIYTAWSDTSTLNFVFFEPPQTRSPTKSSLGLHNLSITRRWAILLYHTRAAPMYFLWRDGEIDHIWAENCHFLPKYGHCGKFLPQRVDTSLTLLRSPDAFCHPRSILVQPSWPFTLPSSLLTGLWLTSVLTLS